LKRVMTIGCGCLCVSLLAAGLATAGNPTSDSHARKLAAKQCASEKKADRGAFRALYGRHAMRNCIKGTSDETKAELKNAAQTCRAEREQDAAAFREHWGTNHNGRNAFGKCVSTTARHEVSEDVAEFKNAAQECKAERKQDPDAFREHWGTNHNGRNALGKCVSSKVGHEDN
jgi:hypothetical protein